MDEHEKKWVEKASAAHLRYFEAPRNVIAGEEAARHEQVVREAASGVAEDECQPRP